MFITSPDIFATWVKLEMPGLYRVITVQDILNMTECGLIKHYRYYNQQDLETVRAILQYEQLQQKRIHEQASDEAKPRKCKRCGRPLTYDPKSRRGRRGEYCKICEPFRSSERNRKWRNNRLLRRG